VLYPLVKALHLIAMVAWFAGLFYLPRILIYSVEALERPPAEREPLLAQLEVMGRRLWRGIAWPAMVATLAFGLWLAVLYNGWSQPWLHTKLTLVACLVSYLLVCGRLRRAVAARRPSWTSHRLRLWNEVATVLLVAIVLVATLKQAALSWQVAAGVVAVVLALAAAVQVYRRLRGAVIPPSPR
jgi:putative membrane protein